MFEPVTVKRKVLEKDVEAYLCRKVKALGGECYKWASMNVRGVPDRIVVINATVWFVEVKKDRQSPLTKLQKHFFDRMFELGIRNAKVVRGKDGVDEWLAEINAPGA